MALWLGTQALTERVEALETAVASGSLEITSADFETVTTKKLTVNESATVNGTLKVANATELDGTLLVKGTATFEGDLVAKKDLRLEGSVLGTAKTRGIDLEVWLGDSEYEVAGLGLPTNASYAVSITPSWETNAWVTDKTEDGFTVNFSVPAPAGARFDYVLIR